VPPYAVTGSAAEMQATHNKKVSLEGMHTNMLRWYGCNSQSVHSNSSWNADVVNLDLNHIGGCQPLRNLQVPGADMCTPDLRFYIPQKVLNCLSAISCCPPTHLQVAVWSLLPHESAIGSLQQQLEPGQTCGAGRFSQ
jgi:hypothetical protein